METMGRMKELRPQVLFYSHDGIGREPEELISRATENTLAFGDIVLEALKTGEKPGDIIGRLQEYINTRFGLNIGKTRMEMMVLGYTGYFKRKGMV